MKTGRHNTLMQFLNITIQTVGGMGKLTILLVNGLKYIIDTPQISLHHILNCMLTTGKIQYFLS